MSRIGKQTIEIPAGVSVSLHEGILHVQGPKGELTRVVHPVVSILVADNTVTVDVKNKEEKSERSLWGTFSSHVQNMVTGVSQGFKKQLEINGVGYRISMQGKDVKLEVGYSHPVVFVVPEGIAASVEKNIITVEGADKETVGRVAAEMRAIRKPEPYKGKGIKYIDEQIRRKAGKAAKA
ncbi:MAG: 50S ribosomal protein L6 [Candidatus Magasanikbacteria bacterium CG10_big_fil_rev_8_21_14_0_10_47_10]|uniref:Large ribosomal subunit protein uL6 n=1 Tax=Candidatus Magasanikbacteria bacterium CG10_big_fil_rev_8_21_14_0_10_47_10 TaxID=1974652 RepID=A0A2H0TP73_9BACT|nr:MAG: 50S ribosomal protein L6 [Candidatus Magasanikbacteria bacterium CG10_big_fil_rev_8_21_14_0_10_47_10]